MDLFKTYLEIGFEHICNLKAYDHLLFVAAMVAIYDFKQIKQILILVTAFTLGHAITLMLATFDIFTLETNLVEFIIPCTIFLTAALNIIKGETGSNNTPKIKYAITLIFGLFHGMGFSNYLKILLQGEQTIFKPLLGFNVGLELGQICIVLAILFITLFLFNVVKVAKRDWIMAASGVIAGISLMLIKDAIFW
jgi:HupE / UreJ protein